VNADSSTSGVANVSLGGRGASSENLSGLATTLYLDQNYLSGIAKRKPAFKELEPVLREALAAGAIEVLESSVHELESSPRPDLHLMELLRGFSRGRRLPPRLDRPAREVKRRMAWVIEHELPERRARHSDAADLEALALALTQCDLVTCDAFMADVIRRARLDLRHRAQLFSGRRADVVRLREIITAIATEAIATEAKGGAANRWRI
jgi:hypothetical protein